MLGQKVHLFLHVRVEEESVKLARKVIVAVDVGPGPCRIVHLVQPAQPVAEALDCPRPDRLDPRRTHVLVRDPQQFEDIAFDDVEVVVHVGFRQCERRVEGDPQFGLARTDDDVDMLARSVAEMDRHALWAGHCQISRPDQTADHTLQEPVHDAIPDPVRQADGNGSDGGWLGGVGNRRFCLGA